VDTTDHKNPELRDIEERFRSIAYTTSVTVWISGPDRLRTFFNNGWLTFSGSNTEWDLSNGWAEAVHPDDWPQCLAVYLRALEARTNFEMEYRLRRTDGEFRWILDRGVPRFSPDGVFAGYIGSCIDLTSLKRYEQELLSKQKMESLGTLAHRLAHDVNNLMSGIVAQADCALDELPAPSAKAAVETITNSARRCSDIVHALMLYAEKGEINVHPVNVSLIVEDILNLLYASIPRYVKLDVVLDKFLPEVPANSSHIRQLVVNLITNASEAIDQKGGSIHLTTSQVTIGPASVRANLPRLSEGDYVRLEVSDTGSGMDNQVLDKIFDRGFTTKGEGRGSGLAASQAIAHKYGGAISVTSTPGKGTTVMVLFPRMVQLPREDKEVPRVRPGAKPAF
jgi:PAS domain S-box-containing protein